LLCDKEILSKVNISRAAEYKMSKLAKFSNIKL